MDAISAMDRTGAHMAQVLRDTLDQLYDGQRTGRYRWDQLYKTEKTHCGTLVEINLQREFRFSDGAVLDFSICGVEVDCKYSQSEGRWMIPPEARGELCLVVWANDESARWSAGIVRALPQHLGQGSNRDGKTALNERGRSAIRWLHRHAELPPNVLLQLPRADVDRIMELKHGTQRLHELFRVAEGLRVGRGVVATVAQQSDYMKRVRANGGSRTVLGREGFVILGQYGSHQRIAQSLGVPVPRQGESVAVRLVPADAPGSGVAVIDGRLWRRARPGEPSQMAPRLPPQ